MLIFTDRQTQVKFLEIIHHERTAEVRSDGRIRTLEKIVFGSLLTWLVPEGHMRVLQLRWCPNDTDGNGLATEFGWIEYAVPLDEYGVDASAPVPLGRASLEGQNPWKRGMVGAAINHGAQDGTIDWGSHT